MFFSFFSQKKGAKALFVVCCLACGTSLFTACVDNPSPAGTLAGTWTSAGGDNFTVNEAAKTFVYWYGTGEPDYGSTMDFAGTIEYGSNSLSSRAGYLTLRLTNSGGWNGYAAGTYIRVFWKDLTGGTVQYATPYKVGGNNNGESSLGAAATEYTVENGYFGMLGAYTKIGN
ncbi:MAG: hypothetical protein Ta2A_17160 [Treponemataceae bacterium]|nr:MAG: hypothetical protein Ta2A_17160 [Treponemataceae bacterium]